MTSKRIVINVCLREKWVSCDKPPCRAFNFISLQTSNQVTNLSIKTSLSSFTDRMGSQSVSRIFRPLKGLLTFTIFQNFKIISMNNFVSLTHSLTFEKYCNAVIVFSHKISKPSSPSVAQCLKDTKLYELTVELI